MLEAGMIRNQRLLFFFVFLLTLINVQGQVIDSLPAAREPGLADSMEAEFIEYLLPPMIKVRPESPEVVYRDIQPLRTAKSPAWHFYIILLATLLLTYIRINFFKEFNDLIQGLFNMTFAQQIQREQELSLPLSALLLNILFALSLSFYLYLIGSYFPLRFSGFTLFMFILASVSLLSVLRYFFLKVAASVFPFRQELNFYNFNIFLVNKIMGIVLIPFLIILSFAPAGMMKLGIYASLIVVFILLSFSYVKGFLIGKDYLVYNKFHFFVYLCTSEIAPVLILVETFNRWIAV